MEGIEVPSWHDCRGRGRKLPFNSAHIFILNDRYPRAGKGRAKAKWHRGGRKRAGPKNDSNHGATEFNISKKLFSFLHGEGQSRFNRDDVPRSWETQAEDEGQGGEKRRKECGVEERGCRGGESGRGRDP